MKKAFKYTIVTLITVILSCILILVIFVGYKYGYNLIDGLRNIDKCYEQDENIYSINEDFVPGENQCYDKMTYIMLPKLLVNDVKYKKEPINLYRIDPTFTIPEQMIKQSDLVLSWGLGYEMGFEEKIARDYNVPVYAFDCGFPENMIKEKSEKHPQVHIQRECIGTDKFIMYGMKSSNKTHTFSEKFKELNLENKKIYLKFGIPEVQKYMDDILLHKDNITGISIAPSLWSPKYIIESLKMFDDLNKDFVLVSRNIVNQARYNKPYHIEYTYGEWTPCIPLTYVNKKMLDSYSIAWNQSNKISGHARTDRNMEYLENSIDEIIVIAKKFKIYDLIMFLFKGKSKYYI